MVIAYGAHSLSESEKEVLDSIVDRVIPSDEHGPGARDAGVTVYICRAIATDYAHHGPAYAAGLAALNTYALAVHGRGFALLAADQQDGLLRDVECDRASGLSPSLSSFFALVRQHVMEGMFGDPGWGGNTDCVGWDLIGYPGPRPVWSAADQQIEASPDKRAANG